jgi:hypothetical protein
MTFGDRFLTLPDLFPARQSGEPWGAERVVIRFAGNDYVCDGLSATQATGLRDKFGGLCAAEADPARPTVEIAVFRVTGDDFVVDEREWEFEFDLDYAPGAVRIAGFHVMARLDLAPPLRAALWTSEDGPLVERSILENVLRMVVAYHLLLQGGVLLHSAAVADARGAHVFFGPSGAGKSTISRLGFASGRQVLSDDMNALRTTADGMVVEKLPFAGDFGPSKDTAEGSCPVRSLCRLEKGQEPALRALRPAAAVAALVECSPYVNRDPYRYEPLVDRLLALNARLPVRVLTFAPDDRFWPLLDQT